MTRVAALVLALLIAGGATAQAQETPVVARADLDRAIMTIGDQLLLTVTVELANGFDLMDPGVPRAIGDFEVVDTLTLIQTRLGSVTRVQLRYLITTFRLGPKSVPVIAVAYRGPNGAQGQARTQGPLAVVVQSVIGPGEAATDIKPLKPPLPVPGIGGDLFGRVWPFAVALALIVIAAVLVLRARRRAPIVAEVPTHGPSRVALDELQRVVELHLPEQGKTREHYELVSAALRAFITQRYGVPAQARTARELRRELERAGVPRTSAQVLCEVLGDAESVRYEQRSIFPARAQKSMRDVIELMRKSVVAEEYELVSSGASA